MLNNVWEKDVKYNNINKNNNDIYVSDNGIRRIQSNNITIESSGGYDEINIDTIIGYNKQIILGKESADKIYPTKDLIGFETKQLIDPLLINKIKFNTNILYDNTYTENDNKLLNTRITRMKRIRQISSIKFYDSAEIQPEKQFVINVTRYDLDEDDNDYILCVTDKEIYENIKVGDHIAGKIKRSNQYIGKIKINTGKVADLTHISSPVPEYITSQIYVAEKKELKFNQLIIILI